MSDTTTSPSRADQACNCQAPSRAEGPWHPLGDTPFCPPPPETPADVCRWLLTLDDPEDVVGREDRRTVNLTEIIQRARLALAAEETAR